MRKKILMVHHGKGIGGAPKSMSLLVKRLVNEGHDVTVLLLQNSEAKDLFMDCGCSIAVSRVPIYYFYHVSNWVKAWQIHKLLLQLLSFIIQLLFVSSFYIRKYRPEVIYLNSSVLIDWGITSKALGIKTVHHIREMISHGHFGIRKKIIQYYFKRVPTVTVNISKAADRLLKIEGGRTKSVVIPNYCHELQVDLSPEMRLLDNKAYDFIYVGGEAKIKGFDILFELIKNDDEFNYIVCGYFQTKEHIDYLKSKKNVLYLGVSKDIHKYMSEAKFLLNLFTTPHFSRPIIEAYQAGSIPISMNYDGVDELIEDGVTGYILKADSISALSSEIRRFAQIKSSDYNSMVDKGDSLYRSRFSSRNEDELVRLITSEFM